MDATGKRILKEASASHRRIRENLREMVARRRGVPVWTVTDAELDALPVPPRRPRA